MISGSGKLYKFCKARIKKLFALSLEFYVVKLFVTVSDDLHHCAGTEFGVLNHVAYLQMFELNFRCVICI